MELFERIRRGLIGESGSLGLCSQVSKVQIRPSDSLFLLPVDADVELSATCLSVPVFPAMMIMNEISETISQP